MKASRYDPSSSDYEFEFFDLENSDLIVEWNRQPKLMFQHGCLLADAERKAKQADVEVDLIEAEMDAEIRKRYTKYGFEKPPTEAALKLAIRRTDKWKNAKNALIRAEHDRDIYKAAVQALEHRKIGLGKRVDLNGQQYWADPKAKNTEEFLRMKEEDSENIMRAISKKMNEKKSKKRQ